MNPDPQIYEEDDAKPVTGPNLKALEGGGEKTEPKQGHLKAVPNDTEAADASEATGSSGGSKPENSADLARAESASSGQANEFNFRPDKKESLSALSSFGYFLGSNRKKLLIGGGAAGSIVGTIVFIFLSLIPLKVEHIVNNLQNRFFASSENAIQTETQNMFKNYVISRVLPGYKSCGTTIDRHCTARQFGSNPVSSLYKSWSQARLENTLAEQYGIEFKFNSKSNSWHLISPGLGSKGADIGSDGQKLDQLLTTRSGFRSAVGASLDNALQNETKWKQLLYRYKVGRLLEAKYGLKRCIVYCGVDDPLKDSVATQKISAKLYLTQRVIVPRTQTLGIALQCIFTNCDPTHTQANGDTGTPGANGAPADQSVDQPVSQGLRDLAATYDITDEASLKALQDTYNKISEKGFQNWLISEGLIKAGISTDIAGKIASSIPIAGWINLAAQIVNTGNNADSTIKKLRYVVNGSAAVSLYMMYRTYADEIHTGHVSATEVGSMVNSLGPGNSGNPKDPILGGVADASSTPLYQSLIDGTNSTSTPKVALLDQILPSKVYAASSSNTSVNANNYLCNDGKPIPKGQLVCPEESLGGGNSFANSIHSFLNIGGGVIPALAAAWSSTIGQAFNLISGFFSAIFQAVQSAADASCSIPIIGISGIPPGYCPAKKLVESGISTIVQGVTTQLIPNPFSTNMSGGRTFDMMAAGADVAGNDYAHNGIGGHVLTSGQVATIYNNQQNEAQQQFSNQPIFARIFSTDSQYSLISKVAMAMPLGWGSSASSFASILSNPISLLSHSFSSVFSVKTSADTSAQNDPFSVTQYGYSQSDLKAIGDPETYWDNNCTTDSTMGYQKDNSYNQAAAGTVDPNTGMPVNNNVNYCELIVATTGNSGGFYDKSLLTQDDTADLNGPSTPTGGGGTTTGGLTDPFPGGWTPNRLDMGYDGTFKGQIVAPFSGTIFYASSSFSNWGGYIELKADQQPSGLPTSSLYFAEGVSPIVSSGHVNAGTPIANPAPSPYGNAYGTTPDGSGQIEWGVAVDGSPGTPTNPLAESGISNPAQMVLNFSAWAQKSFSLPPPSQTSSAGYP